MKRFAALAMAMALCLSIFTGCSGKSGGSASGAGTSGSAASGEWQPNRSVTMLVPWSAGGALTWRCAPWCPIWRTTWA